MPDLNTLFSVTLTIDRALYEEFVLRTETPIWSDLV